MKTSIINGSEVSRLSVAIQQSLQVEFNEQNIISIASHIKGENAVAGNYHGSAWLIATYE